MGGARVTGAATRAARVERVRGENERSRRDREAED